MSQPDICLSELYYFSHFFLVILYIKLFLSTRNHEAHSSACQFPPSTDVTSDIGSNLTSVCANTGTLGCSEFANRELQHHQVMFGTTLFLWLWCNARGNALDLIFWKKTFSQITLTLFFWKYAASFDHVKTLRGNARKWELWGFLVKELMVMMERQKHSEFGKHI